MPRIWSYCFWLSNNKVVTLNEGDLVDESDEEEKMDKDVEDKEDEEVTNADIGESLLVRRSLISIHEDGGKCLQKNIFWTRCTANDKVCDIIVNSGSYENVVAEDLVKKLKLREEGK